MRNLAVIVIALSFATGAWAQAWRPEKTVEFIVPTGAGGNSDKMTRIAQKILQDHKLLTTPSVILNRTGGNQTLAVIYTLQHPGDAHYVLFLNPTIFANELNGITPHRYTELTPLALLVIENTVLTVRAESPIKNMSDLIARLKADPESMSFGMPPRGGQPHLTAAAAVRAAGADARKMKAVVFKGSGESTTALLGGHVDVMVSSSGSVLPLVQAGKARVLAVAAAQRMGGSFANAPTFREQGIDSTGIPAWRAFFGPPKLTPAQIAFWDEALAKMAATPEWKKYLEDGDLTQQFLRSREFGRYLDAEYANTKAIMGELGLVKQP
ncbi:MAG TPA: tripartite tricarboxylate transporter substrate binding protein [Candidatus Didemnitutus sp.]